MRYVALDAVRGSAAFAVLFYHLVPHGATAAGTPLRFASGYLAVDLFFILSGFVISHAYERRLQNGLEFCTFMKARFVRLQPVLAIGTIAGFVVALWQRSMHLEGAPGVFEIATSLPANLMMFPNVLVPWGIFLFNPPAWSLFYELLANIVYAMGLKWGSNNPLRIRPDIILTTMCGLGLCGLTVSALILGDLDRGVVLQDWPVAVSRVGFGFPLGVLLHRTRGIWMRYIPAVPLPVLLLASLALLSLDFSAAGRVAYDLCFVVLCAPVLVMLAVLAEPHGLFMRLAEWLGMISYPLYALQAPIKHALAITLPLSQEPLLAVTTLTAVSAAWALALVEPELRGRLDRLLTPRPPSPADTSGAQAPSSNNP
ncbi:acyltransferase family protein [Novosphingobium gossypii]|uniref:acyltransferase family protein n=1 Tax=Novosphingobium gossypii TaxID=1604774 RepID=UPI003D2074B1